MDLLNYIRETKKTFRGDLSERLTALIAIEHLYWLCLASEQVLIDAAAEVEKYSDEYTIKLCNYYLRHVDEEKDEVLILEKDLASAGLKMKGRLPFFSAMDLIGSQYYLMKHVHPACLLGLLAVQEADPMEISKVEALEKLHGKELFSFCRLHAIKDLDHKGEVLDLIEEAPENLKRLIYFSTQNVLDHLRGFYC